MIFWWKILGYGQKLGRRIQYNYIFLIGLGCFYERLRLCMECVNDSGIKRLVVIGSGYVHRVILYSWYLSFDLDINNNFVLI